MRLPSRPALPATRLGPRTRVRRGPAAALVVGLALAAPAAAQANAQATGRTAAQMPPATHLARQVEIRRTAYGIPHIRAENVAAAGFGLQAELFARGEMKRVLWLERDIVAGTIARYHPGIER